MGIYPRCGVLKRTILDSLSAPYVLVVQEEELLVRCQRLCPFEKKNRSVARSLAQDPSESRGTLAASASYI